MDDDTPPVHFEAIEYERWSIIVGERIKDLRPLQRGETRKITYSHPYFGDISVEMNNVATWERPAIFAFGVLFVAVLLIIALFFPTPTSFQYTVFRIVLALAAAGVAALIPGLINVEIPAVKSAEPMIRAGGAIAIFVIVFWFSPAALVVNP